MNFKKILLFILTILLFFIWNFSSANWYWEHQVSYSSDWITRCTGDWDCNYDSDGNITSCSNNDYPDIDFNKEKDWNQYKDYAVDINWDNKITNDDYVSSSSHQKVKKVDSTWKMDCFYWDGIAPTTGHLTLKLNWTTPNWAVLANKKNNNLLISYDDTNWWRSPNITIYYQLENKNTSNFDSTKDVTLHTNNSTGSTNVSWDVSKVLPSTDFNTDKWWRQYSIKITKMCDSAWNCISPNQIYNWRIYANNPNWHEHLDISDLDNYKTWNNLDNYTTKLTLKDSFWNPVVPAPWIHRKVTLSGNYNNDVYLDQYHATWKSWIKIKFSVLDRTGTNIWDNSNSTWDLISYDDELSGWEYNILFKSYVPTYDGYNKAYWSFYLKKISYQITDNLGSNWNNSFPINKKLKFKPQIYLTFKESHVLAGEWTKKKFTFETKTNSDNYSKYTLWIKFISSNNKIKTYLSYYYTNSWKKQSIYIDSWDLSSSFQDISNNVAMISPFSKINWKYIYEKILLQTWWKISSNDKNILSTHIALKYSDWTVAIYNSDLVWANNYNYKKIANKTYKSPIYILGNLWWSNYKNNFHNIFSWDKLNYTARISMVKVKNKIRKMVKLKFWGIKKTYLNWDKTQDIFSNNITPNLTKFWTKIYYYKWYWENNNLIIPGYNSINNKYLIVVENANVFITWNIQTTNKWLVWIIVLSKTDLQNGNIYINNKITNIDMLIYSDKSLITYKWNPSSHPKIQWNLTQDDLKNQLLIKWVLWTFNTIWWSTKGICPYFNKNCSNPKEYDLYNVRKFKWVPATILDSSWATDAYVPYWITSNTNNPYDSELIWWIKCSLKDCNNDGYKETDCKDKNSHLNNKLKSSWLWCHKFTKNELEKNKNIFSSLIIEYDPKIKYNHFPIFSNM